MPKCPAAWYELNISAPDNMVSACCYYAGEKDPWINHPIDIEGYWNSANIQTIRKINSGKKSADPNGCTTCFFFQNRSEDTIYFDTSVFPDLSEHQTANWKLLQQEYESGAVELTATPVRIYANFGFSCNLACRMCHQVPRRADNKRQVHADSILRWNKALRAAMDVTVIGGEPFALPEAISFIRQFINNPEYDNVRLSICTNGTLHHKHMETLRKKKHLHLAVSLDSIGEGYESIRVNSKWSLVERNILEFVELARKEYPQWSFQTNALVLKTGVKRLPEYARWHAKHGIVTSFYDFINFRGTEDAFYSENLLENPQLLDDIPDWSNYFEEALDIFQKSNLTVAATSLDHYWKRLTNRVEEYQATSNAGRNLRHRNHWKTQLEIRGPKDFLNTFQYILAAQRTGETPDYASDETFVRFTKVSYPRDHFLTSYMPMAVYEPGGYFRLRLSWPKLPPGVRRAHVVLRAERRGELQGTWYVQEGDDGIKAEFVGRMEAGIAKLQLAAYPVGERESVLPTEVLLDLDGATMNAVAATDRLLP
ncbi:radical SAM protein [Azospirillum brasilense]|uniref:radical SAM protein n=1 Tax=Azospirillum brasilense TaxID=192 RepID=UPI001EDC9053|nr:radical SAM protein [Azospirillum brasilense]UKJ78134.1 radical SAM protein [Azospirillum brasilense]